METCGVNWKATKSRYPPRRCHGSGLLGHPNLVHLARVHRMSHVGSRRSISIRGIQGAGCLKTFPPTLRQSNVISFLSGCHLSPYQAFSVCFLPTGREDECLVLELCNAALSSAPLMSVRLYTARGEASLVPFLRSFSPSFLFSFPHMKFIFHDDGRQ